MRWVCRWFGTGFVVTILILIWWYPVPSLYLIEVPDWAAQYERQYQAPAYSVGALSMYQETMRSLRTPQSLSDFIMAQIERQELVELSPEAWNALALFIDAAVGTRDYYDAHHPSFQGVDASRGILHARDDGGIHLLRFSELQAAQYPGHPIPVPLRYPLRRYSLEIVAAALTVMVLFNKVRGDPRIRTSSIGPSAAAIAFLLALSSGLLLWPFLYGYEQEVAGLVSILIGLLLVPALGAGFLVIRSQVLMTERLLAGREVLVSWHFSPAEWEPYWRERFATKRSSQTVAWLLVSGLSLALGGYLFYTLRSPWTGYLLTGVVVGGGLWRIQMAGGWHRQEQAAQHEEGDVYIGPDGIYSGGDVHRWRGLLTRFQSASVQRGDNPRLLLAYTSLSGEPTTRQSIPSFYWQETVVYVPIPEGREDEAEQVAERLQRKPR